MTGGFSGEHDWGAAEFTMLIKQSLSRYCGCLYLLLDDHPTLATEVGIIFTSNLIM